MTPSALPSAAEFARMIEAGWKESAGTALDPQIAGCVGTHLHLLYLWNRRVNLTAIREPETGVRRHALESLEGLLLSDLPGKGLLVDLGSGNGFPALPLLAAHPGLTGLLIESSARKVDFLRAVLRETGLSGRVRVDERHVGLQTSFPEETVVVTLRGFPHPLEWIERAIAALPRVVVLAWLAADDAEEIRGQIISRGGRAVIRPIRSSGVGAILRASY